MFLSVSLYCCIKSRCVVGQKPKMNPTISPLKLLERGGENTWILPIKQLPVGEVSINPGEVIQEVDLEERVYAQIEVSEFETNMLFFYIK